MTEAETMVEEAALEIAILDGCGLMIDGERALCDDLRAETSTSATHCFCRASARAACEIAVRRCAEKQPCTAASPDDSQYQRGHFDGVMEYATAINSLAASIKEGK